MLHSIERYFTPFTRQRGLIQDDQVILLPCDRPQDGFERNIGAHAKVTLLKLRTMVSTSSKQSTC